LYNIAGTYQPSLSIMSSPKPKPKRNGYLNVTIFHARCVYALSEEPEQNQTTKELKTHYTVFVK